MNKTFTLRTIFTLFFSALLWHAGFSQDGDKAYSEDKIESFKADVQNMVAFLEYSFNTLGNPATTARDKDVIINQSYAKLFKDAQVQIEDDLDDNRETLINKDVQAYLKDIDFFFEHAVFSLNISSIDHHFKGNQEIYFIVTLTRTLNAKTVLGDSISSNRERFIEINYDDVAQDLRIASIYTTRIDEKDELFAWWNKMPEEWRKVLGSEATIRDSIPFSSVVAINDTMAVARYFGMMEVPVDTFLVYDKDTLFISESEQVEGFIYDTILPRKNFTYRMLQRIAAEPEIDISGNLNIRTLEPLSQMSSITKVNCANTMVSDLSPLRNLINIEALNCSGTAVTDLSSLQYSVSLVSLDIHATRVTDLEPLANLRNLEALNISGTAADSIETVASLIKLSDFRLSNTVVSNLESISSLERLRIINISGTQVDELSALRELHMLERLYISNTSVDDLSPLEDLNELQTIYLDSTNVGSLAPLDGLKKLERIYCDNTGISGSKADAFMAKNPNTIVIYESVALARWWESMPEGWQGTLIEIAGISTDPGKEELHRAIKITEIDVSGRHDIKSLSPLKRLVHLKRLECSETAIDNLWPLADLIDLQYLDCSHTALQSCDGLRDLMNLEYLDISHTNINNIQCISRIKNLHELNISNTGTSSINIFGESNLHTVFADDSGIGLGEVIAFKKENPECIVVYQTPVLESWYAALNTAWQEVFAEAIGIKNGPDPVDLQKMADLEEIDLLQSNTLGSLDPLKKLYRLRELRMNDTQISDLEPISEMNTIETLVLSNNPVTELSMIAGLHNLRHLDFKNTPVDDLEPLSGLVQLEILDMAGTQIKKINELASLGKLRQLSVYNTGIKSLSPIMDLGSLETVRCYNTRLNAKKVRQFKEAHPDCEVVYY